MNEELIQQYMKGDSRQNAISHLKTLELYDKAILELEAEREKVAELTDKLNKLTT